MSSRLATERLLSVIALEADTEHGATSLRIPARRIDLVLSNGEAAELGNPNRDEMLAAAEELIQDSEHRGREVKDHELPPHRAAAEIMLAIGALTLLQTKLRITLIDGKLTVYMEKSPVSEATVRPIIAWISKLL